VFAHVAARTVADLLKGIFFRVIQPIRRFLAAPNAYGWNYPSYRLRLLTAESGEPPWESEPLGRGEQLLLLPLPEIPGGWHLALSGIGEAGGEHFLEDHGLILPEPAPAGH